jgi:hypothetical protein
MGYADYVSINILVWKKGMLHLLPFVLSLIQWLIKVICNSTMFQLTPRAANMRWILDDEKKGNDLRPACLTLFDEEWQQWRCYSGGVDWI